MADTTFDVLMLIARPAAGKSEIMHYLKNTPPAERAARFHIGAIDEIDDFPMLWTWFEEDELLAQMGYERLHSDENGYFKGQHLWNLLIRRIGLEYSKRQRDYPASSQPAAEKPQPAAEKPQPAAGKPQPAADRTQPVTALVEFARGTEHGGWREAFQHITPELAGHAAILYIDVSYEESLRKNRRRYNPKRPDSILEHGLSDEKLERLYQGTDWIEVSGGQPEGRLAIAGQQVPFVVFENEDDVTTQGGEALGQRLADRLARLWALY